MALRFAWRRLDVVVLALPCDCGGADTMTLARDEFLVALPPGGRLASPEAVPASALATERRLLLEAA